MSVSLSVKLGAIDAVNKLRHAQMQVDENINIEARRKQVAAELAAYYAHQGVTCDDSLLDEGVRAYFDSRFNFVPVELSWFDRYLAKAYVTRDLWGGAAIKGASGLALALALYAGGMSYHQDSIVAGLEVDSISAGAYLVDLNRSLDAVDKRLSDFVLSDAFIQSGSLKPELASFHRQAKARIDALKQSPPVLVPHIVSYDNREAITRDLSHFNVAATNDTLEIDQINSEIDAASSIISLYHHFVEMPDRYPDWKSSEFSSAHISTSIRDLHQLFASARYSSGRWLHVTDISQKMDSLESLFRFSVSETGLVARQDSLRAAFNALNLSKNDADRVDALFFAAQKGFSRGSYDVVNDALIKLRQLYDFSQQSLELRIVSRPGVNSGVRRTSRDYSDAHSYYIVVEAIAPDGRPSQVDVTNAETQKTQSVSMFAVGVEDFVYNALKADKKADGIIDDVHMGNKPKGQLSFVIDRSGVSNKFITEW